jgi:non-specific serine/threonine protein kinase
LTSFVGRERELADLQKLLGVSPLVTLVGTGGTGKTRLALHLARSVEDRFRHGVAFVPLAPIVEPGQLLPTVAQTLGLPEIGRRDPLVVLSEYLRDRELLLVLDNFEHLLPADRALVDLIEECSRLAIVVTSRFPLRLSPEQEYEVRPLSVPQPGCQPANDAESVAALLRFDSVRLFVERARAVKADFDVTPCDVDALAKICSHLDGLPLAVELAAARVRLYPLKMMADRLSVAPWERRTSPLQLLDGGPRDVPERHRTLRSTIDWSYALLTDSEQVLFRRLAIFFGGASLEAIQACAGSSSSVDRRWAAAPDEVLADAEALIAKNLLVRKSGLDGNLRLDMLEMIREFGLERLAEAGELDATRRWHAEYFATIAHRAEPHLRGREQQLWLDRLEADHDNLRAALGWGLTADYGSGLALRLAGALAPFWLDRGYASEGRRWLERALAVANGSSSARLKALYGAAWLAHVQRDGQAARGYMDAAERLAIELDDRWALAWIRHLAGRVAYFEGDAASATRLAQQSLALSRELGDDWLIAWALHLLGLAAHIAGDYANARGSYDAALEIRRQLGYAEGIGICLNLLAIVAYRQHDLARAQALAHESLVTLRDLGARWTVHNPLVTIAAVAAATGRSVVAVRLSAAIDVFSQLVDVTPIPLAEDMLDDALTAARLNLGGRTYAASWESGRLLSLDDAVSEALAESADPEPHDDGSTSSPAGLSPREREVLQLIAAGNSSKAIARTLAVSVTTIERHITHVYEKLGVHGRAEATSYALRHGLA